VPTFPNQESLLSYDSSLKLAEEKINSFGASLVEVSSGRNSEQTLRFSFRPNFEMLSQTAVEENNPIMSSNSGAIAFSVPSTTSELNNAVDQELDEPPITPEEVENSRKIINKQDNMNASESLTYIILGIVLGMIGQSIRAIVGVKKSSDEASFSEKAFKDWFEAKRLVFGLVIGASSGALAAISQLGSPIDQQLLITIVASGYAGADFIEGFMRTKVPRSNN
jgi:hypothetical protein